MGVPSAFVTVVSGSPRDGTALIMKMLGAGGSEVLVDDAPKPGQPEPHGYYDYAPSLALDVDVSTSDWVAEAAGKAVKVMSYQLQYLSPAFAYRLVFVCRRLADAVAEWPAMGLALPEGAAAGPDPEAVAAALLHRETMPALFVIHADLKADPAAQASCIAEFLGLPLAAAAMAAAAQAG